MRVIFRRSGDFVNRLGKDAQGVILPYVAILLTVFVGMSALALDAGRYMSLQTQMQAIADALALAGARELNRADGAINRANQAVNNIVSNGITGLGYSGGITHSTTFYSSLNEAGAGYGGATTSLDSEAKFVSVTVNPVTISTIMPISFFKSGGSNSFGTGARAIAGNQGKSACGISPMFICNPYEVSGMTDGQGIAALHAALDPKDPNYNAIARRRLFRMDATKTSPGHFGWLQPADKCNNTQCLNHWLALDSASALSRSCYNADALFMATGNKPVADAFNDRFDIYSVPGINPSSDTVPSINVRKGYVAGNGGDWCNPSKGDYLSAQSGAVSTVSLASANATIAAIANNKKFITISSVVGTIASQMSFVKGVPAPPTGTPVGTVSGDPSGTTIPVKNLDSSVKVGDQITFLWLTAPLPLDKQFTTLCADGPCIQGNADWDCLGYWTINHSDSSGALKKPAPTGCTSSNPNVSRYDIYGDPNLNDPNSAMYGSSENKLASNSATAAPIADYSGYPRSTVANGETGVPMCAISKGVNPTGTYSTQYEPRNVHVAVINCLAQADKITGGNSGKGVPAAGFVKFFLTQPYNSDGKNLLYGEMTGLVDELDGVRLYNQVQLYR